jgi:conjugal transfer pilus assembly protein TraF
MRHLAAMALITTLPAWGQTGLDYPSSWQCSEARFHWYCDRSIDELLEPPPAKPNKENTEGEQAVEDLKKLRESVEQKRALAILKPTSENLKSYIVAQEALMDRASVFSDVWRRVIWANPDLNYQLRNPSNNAAIQVRDSDRARKETQTLSAIVKEWGLFFIFRSDCPYCHRLAPTLKYLSEQFGLTVFPVSLDGGGLPEFPSRPGQRHVGGAGRQRRPHGGTRQRQGSSPDPGGLGRAVRAGHRRTDLRPDANQAR